MNSQSPEHLPTGNPWSTGEAYYWVLAFARFVSGMEEIELLMPSDEDNKLKGLVEALRLYSRDPFNMMEQALTVRQDQPTARACDFCELGRVR